MRNTLKDFKTRALARPEVRREYEGLKEEFEILDEILKARAEAGLTQAELAGRLGLSQGRVSHLEQFPQALSFAQLLAWCAALELELSINERNSTATAGAAAQEW